MAERLTARRLIAPALLLALGLAACGNPSAGARQTPAVPKMGYDVSFPQCGVQLPDHADLAIVGLNGTLANNFNPCFADEMAWAKRAGVPAANHSIYVHIANHGHDSQSWPVAGDTPYGHCDGGETAACAYQYGQDKANADLGQLAKSGVNFSHGMVWLDVEPDYSWKDAAGNRAAMEGMASTLQHAGYAVGIYSNTAAWQEIAGAVPSSSNLHNLPVWMLGARTVAQARQNCQSPSFTAGPVAIAQIVGGPIDQDLACR